jgi:hypothetical protein
MRTGFHPPAILFLLPALPAVLAIACGIPAEPQPAPTSAPSRADSLPPDAKKYLPGEDFWPPEIAEGWTAPVPLDGPINTAGGEDSPFLASDGSLFFFFTPDVSIPVEKTVSDGVTGIWLAGRSSDGWLEPRRVPLAAPGESHLDGCPTFAGNALWFCSIRAGNARDIDFYTATLTDGVWAAPQNAGRRVNQELQVGEMHLLAASGELFFASKRPGGIGGSDLWVSAWEAGGWGEPRNLGSVVNTVADENRPYVSPDGAELWFDSVSRSGHPGPAVIRCLRRMDGGWDACEEIVSDFAGEPNLSADGRTLYFVHHFYSQDARRMLEADIYVSQKKE